MSERPNKPPVIAHYTTIRQCPNGCPVIVFGGEDRLPFAEAHINLDLVESLIADLREAAANGRAMQRPVA